MAAVPEDASRRGSARPGRRLTRPAAPPAADTGGTPPPAPPQSVTNQSVK